MCSPKWEKLRGTHKTRLPRKRFSARGRHKNMTSPQCGEDTIYKYINFPRIRVVTGVGEERA